jgi:putative flippase GtrA
MVKVLSRLLRTEFLRYLLVGGLAFLADFGTLALLHHVLGMYYLLATLIAFLVGVTINYQLSVCWVFHYRDVTQRSVEFMVFVMIGVMTMGVSIGLMALLVGWFGLAVLVAKCVVTAFTLVANFVLRRALLFSQQQRQQWAQVATHHNVTTK